MQRARLSELRESWMRELELLRWRVLCHLPVSGHSTVCRLRLRCLLSLGEGSTQPLLVSGTSVLQETCQRRRLGLDKLLGGRAATEPGSPDTGR